jgi:outer membrane protein OmpA-like peptidoglycan-associated protein
MVTLLLSFFIMLQALAKSHDPLMFLRGRGGFRRAIDGLGIPDWLFGKNIGPDMGHRQPKYPMEEDPENLGRERVIHLEDEKVRKLYDDLRRLTQAKASDYEGSPARLMGTPIRFEPGGASLDGAAEAFLRDFAHLLERQSGGRPLGIHVVGLAPDEAAPHGQWLLSARRAKAVQEFLEASLPASLKDRGTRVDGWGAGRGERWIGPVPARRDRRAETFIVLAIMEPES